MGEIWAQVVERRILAGDHLAATGEDAVGPPSSMSASSSHSPQTHHALASQAFFGETVYLFECTGGGGKLHGALDHGRALDSVRVTMGLFDKSWILRSGARALVHPDQYEKFLRALSLHKLRPHHVVVSEAFLPLVNEDVAALRSKANIRMRSVQPVAMVGGAGDVATVQRTFLGDFAQMSQHRSREMATQSDSQAHHIPNSRG